MKLEKQAGFLLVLVGAVTAGGVFAGGVKVSERFGYDPADSTKFLQAALDSGLPEIVLDKKDGPWITKELKARSNQKIVLEKGVELQAKRGDYRNGWTAVIDFREVENVTLSGYGAKIRMWREDYVKPPYSKAEWRHALTVLSASKITIEGLTVEDSGGDGIYVGAREGHSTSRDIVLRDLVCERNHRQGLSVITVDGLLVENCAFNNTKGAPPEAGIDFEPNGPGEMLRNCVIRNCSATGNAGNGYAFYDTWFCSTSQPISIRFENCTATRNGFGFHYACNPDKDGTYPTGFVTCKNCTFSENKLGGIRFWQKSAKAPDMTFENCRLIDNGRWNPDIPDISFKFRTADDPPTDGLVFKDLYVRQAVDKPWIERANHNTKSPGISRISGNVTVEGKKGTERFVLDAVTVERLFPPAEVTVSVTETTVGDIKRMNAVNNGPVGSPDNPRDGNAFLYRAAKIPFARTHDSNFQSSYGAPHTVDISAVFPEFAADENDPKSYDFSCTDDYLGKMRAAGTEPFYRLGQSIENGVKKYHSWPPKNYAKWARVCEHVIRHYNEGWADGFRWNVRYWEIWNEPNLDPDCWQTAPRCWGGSEEMFYDLFETAVKHLKEKFPGLRIGGPADAGNDAWCKRFLAAMHRRNVPMDFFSWHIYAPMPEALAGRAKRIRKMMEENGYGKIESFLDEWNYIRDWRNNEPYSLEKVKAEKGAAYAAAAMSICQEAPVDMLMYYDARPQSGFNGLFSLPAYRPLKGYYAFYAWSKLRDLGSQIKTDVELFGPSVPVRSGSVKMSSDEKPRGYYATAARGKGGRAALLVVRYCDVDDVSGPDKIRVIWPGIGARAVTCHLTDSVRAHTEVPFRPSGDFLDLVLEPNSFVLVETHN